jgi:hypothetical protein
MLDPDQIRKLKKLPFGTATVPAAFKGCEALAQVCPVWKQ